VIAADPSRPFVSANLGTAERYDGLGKLENLRPSSAQANLCVFRIQPFLKTRFDVTLLERHPHSTQLFSPMGGVRRYLVIVALGKADAAGKAALAMSSHDLRIKVRPYLDPYLDPYLAPI
jgi:ureidoglycolate hydrolase